MNADKNYLIFVKIECFSQENRGRALSSSDKNGELIEDYY